MAVVGVLEIQMAADLARLTKDMDRAKQSVAGTVRTINNVLGTIGVGISFAVIGTMIKDVTALNQRYQELGISLGVVGRNVGISRQVMFDTAKQVQALGISMIESRETVLKLASANIDLSKATQLADLARNAAIVGQTNTSDALNKLVTGINSASTVMLRNIGVNVSFVQAYAEMGKELGKTSNQLTTTEKQNARLNAVLAQSPALVGLYEAAMSNAGKQFRSTERLIEDLKVKLGGLFDLAARSAIMAYTDTLKSLDSGVQDLTGSGDMERWGDSVARTLAFMGDGARSLVSVFKIVGLTIGAAAAQAAAVANFDFKGVGVIQDLLEADIAAEVSSMSKLRDAVEDQIVQRNILSESVTGYSGALQKAKEEEVSAAKVSSKSVSEQAKFIASLQDEINKVGLDEFAIKKLEAAKLGLSKVAGPLIDKLQQENKALDDQQEIAKKLADDLSKIESITQSVQTAEEKFIETQKELNRLLGSGLSIESYNRALAKARDELNGVSSTAKTTFNEMDQYAIGAARNIQSAFANFLFDPFEGGLKGMFKSFANILRRMVAEMAASGLLRAVSGGSSLFSGFGGGTSSGGGSSGLFNTANLLSAGSTIYQGFSGGLAASVGTLASTVGSATGSGTLAAFGAGASGDALGGLVVGLESGLSGSAAASAASTGASAAMGAIPIVGWAMLANTIANGLLENDKKIAGMSSDKIDNITRLGLPNLLKSFLPSFFDGLIANPAAKLITALFGRGPFKQKETNLIGTVTGEGFDGVTSTKIKSQGGAFVSDITKRVLIDLKTGLLAEGSSRKFDAFAADLGPAVKALGEILDGAISVINTTVSKTSTELGLGSTSGFATNVNIASEKGQFFTPEQITAELQRVEDEFIRYVIPSIDTLAKAGETVTQTFQRIGVEFNSMVELGNLLGHSNAVVKDYLRSLTPQDRNSFVESAGGIDALSSKTQFFFDNILTDADKLKIKTDDLSDALKEYGINTIVTADQLRTAFLKGDLSPALINAGLNLQGLILEVDNLGKSVSGVEQAAEGASGALASATSSVRSEIGQISGYFDSAISDMKKMAQSFRDEAIGIRGGVSQNETRARIEDALTGGRNGRVNFRSIEGLSDITPNLSGLDQSRFSSRIDLQKRQSDDAILVERIAVAVDDKVKEYVSARRDYTKDMYDLLRGMTDDGQTLKTVAT